MSKEIDINNEEQILKECDFDYYYNSENCSRELCKFYNDICHEEDNKFAKTEAYVDLGRIGITLNKQAKQISDLEAKLAEKDSEIKVGEFWHSAYQGKQLDYDKVYAELRQSYDENEKLKQHLAEKDRQIEQLKKFDDLNKTFFDLFRTAFKEPNKVDDLFNTLKTMQEKQDQDKISFAVEQLEKVKTNILSNITFGVESVGIMNSIDNQIKQLKEMK